jgi:hypothetical protein
MLYTAEFERLKKIYDEMDEAKREMIGPMVLMPFAAMAVFGLVLVPFGVIRLIHVPFIGLLAAVGSALMIAKVMDIRNELRQWRESRDAAPLPSIAATAMTDTAALRLAAAANDPGNAAENTAGQAGENRQRRDNAG